MKKGMMMFLLVMSVSILLVGCGTGNKNADNSSLTNSFNKTQKVEVISPDGSDIITSISDDKDIETFVKSLKIDDWDSAKIPSESTKGKIFKMYQEDTIKLSESDKPKGNLNEIATITTYKDAPYIEFSLKNYSFSYKVPEEVFEYLNSNQY